MNGTEKYLWKLAVPLFAFVLGASYLVHAQSKSRAGTGPSEKARRNVAILLFEGVELLDFAGPGEVFSAAGSGGAFDVFTVGGEAGLITSQGFVTIRPEYTIANSPRPDILVLPGGGVGSVIQDDALMDWIKRSSRDAELVLSVCNGALVLAKAGLLDGLEATTHHGSIAGLRKLAPRTKVHENRRFVDNGKIVTAGGVSAGIDAALHIVERLLGPSTGRMTARYMEYRWDRTGS
jgi:transcriptional regulator GlxA family with amidase domain